MVRCLSKCPTFFSSITSPGRSFLCSYLINVLFVCLYVYVWVCGCMCVMWDFWGCSICSAYGLHTGWLLMLVCILMGSCAGFGGIFGLHVSVLHTIHAHMICVSVFV